MGTVRLLLALAVVFGHAPGWQQIQANAFNPVRPIEPYFAVQAFFIISGFYMEMIRRRYEAVSLWVFWSNRYSRLVASYFVIVLITVLLAMTFTKRAPPFLTYSPDGIIERLFLDVANLSIFGTDLIAFLGLKPLAGLVLSQSWSLGLELWFYLLVPIFWRMKTRYIVAIFLLSYVLRIAIVASSLPIFPWQQRFLPAELGFFLVGLLSYRHRQTLTVFQTKIAWPILIFGILFSGWITTSSAAFGAGMALIFYTALPSIWQATRALRIDRAIGELSYPVYLVHITVGYFVLQAQSMWGGGLLMLLSIAAAIPLYILIDRPLDTWRERRRQHALDEDNLNKAFIHIQPERPT